MCGLCVSLSLHYALVDFVECGLVVCRVNILFMYEYLFVCNPFNYDAFFNFRFLIYPLILRRKRER